VGECFFLYRPTRVCVCVCVCVRVCVCVSFVVFSWLQLLSLQTEDVEKLKQDNRKLRVDIQLLTREIDLANDGQSKLLHLTLYTVAFTMHAS